MEAAPGFRNRCPRVEGHVTSLVVQAFAHQPKNGFNSFWNGPTRAQGRVHLSGPRKDGSTQESESYKSPLQPSHTHTKYFSLFWVALKVGTVLTGVILVFLVMSQNPGILTGCSPFWLSVNVSQRCSSLGFIFHVGCFFLVLYCLKRGCCSDLSNANCCCFVAGVSFVFISLTLLLKCWFLELLSCFGFCCFCSGWHDDKASGKILWDFCVTRSCPDTG